MDAPLRRAQGHVQDRALLGDVDLLAAEHGVDPRPQAGFLGELQEQFERFVRDAILGVVQVNARGFGGHALAARGVLGEQLPQMQFPDLLIVGLEGFPCGAFDGRARGEWFCEYFHFYPPAFQRGLR